MRAGRTQVKITRSGFIYIGLTIALGVGAANTGNNLLYLMASLMLALMLLSGVSSLANLRGLEILVEPPEEIFAGVPAGFALRVRKRRGNAFFLRIRTPFGRAHLPFVRGEARVPFWLTFPERGRTRLDALEVQSGFPLGFFLRRHLRSPDLGLVVYPRPVHEAMPPLSGTADGADPRLEGAGETGDEVRGLRLFRSTDPLRRVDWKATARRGRMIVREFDRTAGRSLTIDLTGSAHAWESALSRACHLVLEGYRLGLHVGLVLPDRELPPAGGAAHRRELLEVLSEA
jgi:uncharacterized protein (DUF58 family)